jgi:hypothetical protein
LRPNRLVDRMINPPSIGGRVFIPGSSRLTD